MSRELYGTIKWNVNPIRPGITPISREHLPEISEYCSKIKNELDMHRAEPSYSAHKAVSLVESGFVTPEILEEINNIKKRINELRNAARNRLPHGLITPFDGHISNIPNTWKFCDGNSNTPDIRGKYVLGGSTSSTYPLHSSGGELSWENQVESLTNILKSHTHKIENAFYLEDSTPSDATFRLLNDKRTLGSNYTDWDNSLAYFDDYTDYAGGSASSSVNTSTLPNSVRLPFIMKIQEDLKEYTITITQPSTGGRILVDGEVRTSYTVKSGSIVTLVADANIDYEFKSFTVNGIERGTPCYVCVESDTRVSGVTRQKLCSITVVKSPYGVTTVNGASITTNNYVYNSNITVNTEVDPDYIFTGYKIEYKGYTPKEK